MAPWALNALGIAAPNEVFRLRRLQPSAFRRAPDLVITKTSPPQPVEVKHALNEAQLDAYRLSIALQQVAVGMAAIGSQRGYLVLCTARQPPPVRYSVQVVPIVP
jgi:hypothetical protein